MKSIVYWFVLVFSIALIASSCAKEDSSSSSTSANSSSSSTSDNSSSSSTSDSDSSPYFTGTPATTAMQGTAYNFTPTIVNPENVTLHFSMLNQPSWISVDNSTGVTSGTPNSEFVGKTFTNLLYMMIRSGHMQASPPFSLEVNSTEISATSIHSNSEHTCALDNSSGIVKCWGAGGNGRLGYGNTNNLGDGSGEMGDNLPFVELGTGRTARAISAGSGHTCAILDNASVKCWGRGGLGILGMGNTNSGEPIGDEIGDMGDNLPVVDLGTGRTATAISAGSTHTCAILDNGSVKCWGEGRSGRLGYGNTNNLGDGSGEMGDNLPVVDLGTGRTATAISAGSGHTCAILDNASVKCWGYGSSGTLGSGNTNNLGDGSGEMGDNLPVVDLGTGRTATAISARSSHTCAILDNASVKCWGRGNTGRLGYGNTNNLGDGSGEMGDNLTVVDLGTGRTATAIATAYAHTCAILDNASVKCWGEGNTGRLGSGNTNDLGDGSGEMGDNLTTVNL